ncbi:LysR family transcriptional regulator [Lactiplantibacillus paraplantarum]|uniref:LysR family transcriptional regulator n=1 Tax=Lactiplantibacillus paraplantarum TaxID=60520 RepID=A0AAD0X803_9LACO|nr:LysR family transcriptional regulator [Lactiplantibacillus paraplantarum]AVW10463.1 LysR family transcriptional regulator [Lactiplantibacillus paraplantarum]AYJ38706.1 LysR family transcriptional regulator [Lactiplantibacillus paraplantarum]ERL44210.1 transcriptional regulator, LysR family protein [Lactiplantibacillus paraplantarum]KRL51532.1 LysR family transcriptional regulator [Lactiplantibacillus paraplantarum DSM 10667]MCU4683792.1 LysR family transcriptional regulator [Lactiplantibaci
METRILNYFLTIARLGTISAAARELHVAQPTLSRQIQQLESQLEVPLFTREKHRMTLTKAGLTYQLKVQQILTELNQTNQLIKNINNDALTGTINIGCVESALMAELAPLLVAFHQQNPNVNFDFYDADGTAIQDRLDQNLLEIGFVSTPINAAKYHARRLHINDRWGVAVSKTNHLYQQKFVQIADLKNQSVIIPHRQLVKTELNAWLSPANQALQIVGEYNLLTNATALAANGLGVLICIEGVALPKTSHLKFIPFQPEHNLAHFLIWRQDVPLSKPARSLIDFLKTQLFIS